MRINTNPSKITLLCSLLLALSVSGCGRSDNPDPAASTPATRTQIRDNNSDPVASTPTTRTQIRDNNSDPAAYTPTTRTQRDTDSNLPLTEEEGEGNPEQWRIVILFVITLILGGGGFLLFSFSLVSHLLESEESRTKRQQRGQKKQKSVLLVSSNQATVSSEESQVPQKETLESAIENIRALERRFQDLESEITISHDKHRVHEETRLTSVIESIKTLERRFQNLESEITQIKTQIASPSLFVSSERISNTYFQESNPSKSQENKRKNSPAKSIGNILEAFHQKNMDFFKESYPLNLTELTLQRQSSGIRQEIQFEEISHHRDAAFIAFENGKNWLILPNFLFSYYNDPQYWLYGHEHIFAHSGSGYHVQLVKPAKAEFEKSQGIWKLTEAGQCRLTMPKSKPIKVKEKPAKQVPLSSLDENIQQLINPPDPIEILVNAFNQKDINFFKESYPLNPTKFTVREKFNGTKRMIEFELTDAYNYAAFMTVKQDQNWLILPNFWFSHYGDFEYWLYGNEDIFSYAGSGDVIQLIKPAKAQLIESQEILELTEAGSCVLREPCLDDFG